MASASLDRVFGLHRGFLEYDDEMPAAAKLSRKLKNVNVHATGVFLA